MIRFLNFSVLLIFLSACEDQYLSGGKLLPLPQEEPARQIAPLVIETSGINDRTFFEGETGKFFFQLRVPEPGNAILKVEGLPDGAKLVQREEKNQFYIEWTPDYQAANRKFDPSIIISEYLITLLLRTDHPKYAEATEFKYIYFIVKDVPQPMKVDISPKELSGKEGEELKQTIKVSSPDFEFEDLNLRANLPTGAVLEKDEANEQFLVKYTPPLTEWKKSFCRSAPNCYKESEIEYQVVGPRGKPFTEKSEWKIYDKRMKPRVSYPTKIENWTDIFFTVSAEDLNGEKKPDIKFEKPSFGVFENNILGIEDLDPIQKAEVVEEKDVSNPTAIYEVRWTEIPPDKIGKNYDLKFSVCVNNYEYNSELCTLHKVTVKFDSRIHLPPRIARKDWPLGETKYLRLNEKLKVQLPILDDEVGRAPKDVVIEPAVLAEEIEWKNGYIFVNPKTVGFKQFNITATSIYGMQRTESLLVEVLPESWSSVIVLGESLDTPEVKGVLKFLPNAKVMSPTLGDFSQRNLALRKVLVIGTETAKDSDSVKTAVELMDKFEKVVIHTPLIHKFAKAIYEVFKEALKIEFRFHEEDTGGLTLNDVKIQNAHMSSFKPTINAVSLKGNLTDESYSPRFFDLRDFNYCEPALRLVGAKYTRIVATDCKTKTHRKFLLSGFEFPDLEFDPSDEEIVNGWIMDWVGRR